MDLDEISNSESLDPLLFIQAYEADVICGPQAKLAAQSLEVVPLNPETEMQHLVPKIGAGLIKWGNLRPETRQSGHMGVYDEEDDSDEKTVDDDQNAVWVDRYAPLIRTIYCSAIFAGLAARS
jgi:hypothetical protein